MPLMAGATEHHASPHALLHALGEANAPNIRRQMHFVDRLRRSIRMLGSRRSGSTYVMSPTLDAPGCWDAIGVSCGGILAGAGLGANLCGRNDAETPPAKRRGRLDNRSAPERRLKTISDSTDLVDDAYRCSDGRYGCCLTVLVRVVDNAKAAEHPS